MLTVDNLSENHRRIYEALRDAGRALSPKDIEDLTGLGGSTVRGTVRTMEEKGYIRRVEYGLYFAVDLADVGQHLIDEEKKAYVDARQSKHYIAGGQQRGLQDTSEDDEMMQIPSEILIPIAAGAAVITSDVRTMRRALEMMATKKPFRLLVSIVEEDEMTEPPPQTPK